MVWLVGQRQGNGCSGGLASSTNETGEAERGGQKGEEVNGGSQPKILAPT